MTIFAIFTKKRDFAKKRDFDDFSKNAIFDFFHNRDFSQSEKTRL